MRAAVTRVVGTAPALVRVVSAAVLGIPETVGVAWWALVEEPGEEPATVCPQAPPGMQAFADDVTAWVKWGVLALIVISAVVSLGAILAGRIFSHPHASRYGAMGVAVVVLVAITYTVILVILDSITGSGCT
ncbi:hypothetical protein GCM10027451_29300 [Geodermatophilus aquaeductus]|uniref:Uncharacterized protein n=1 Tax=Geodermatophilus aquaeductus TaxID=1564161 RepID=A0A521F570_9ACTN|nr:hypothetical protein [Geodermatophilus aquaeductus]SMO91317.1 hypothetical protein SAMN06273567_10735 [Geodermatophilus aquaeductus]